MLESAWRASSRAILRRLEIYPPCRPLAVSSDSGMLSSRRVCAMGHNSTRSEQRPMTETAVQPPLDIARKFVPQIRACADEIEATRELPRALFEALADAGMFHLALPRTLGCPELDLPTYIQVIEELGKADASTAWAINQGAIFATYASRMPPEVARTIWIDTPRGVVSNTPIPSAQAVVVPGGYRVTGEQGFSTGCRHASWVAPHAQIIENGHPRLLKNGQPETRYLFVPVAAAGLLREQPIIQVDVGHAEANLRAGRAFLTETVRDVWDTVSTTGTLSMDQRATLRIATTHTIRLAIQVVDTVYNAAGATAVYEGHLLQRAFQDMHVISQHAQSRHAHYELVGRYWLGLPIEDGRL